MYKKNPVFNVTTLSAYNRNIALNFVKKQLNAVSILVNLDSQIDIIVDETSTSEEIKEAISLLRNPNTILYTQISRASCKELCSKLETLNYQDWLMPSFYKKGLGGKKEFSYTNLKKVSNEGLLFRSAKPVVTYSIKNGTSVEFHIQWTYDIPPVFEEQENDLLDSAVYKEPSKEENSVAADEEPKKEEPIEQKEIRTYHTIYFVNNSNGVADIGMEQTQVADGDSFKTSIKFAEGKTGEDIELDNGYMDGDTFVIDSVTEDLTVTISEK